MPSPEERIRELEEALAGLTRTHEASRALLEESRGALLDDLEQAQRFQRSILSPPPRVPDAAFEILYHPVDVVGGDLYDVSALDESRLRIFVADATGHGVSASLTTMFIKSEYEIIKRTVKGPGGALRVLNERICRTYRQLGMRFSAVCIGLDLRRGQITWATAAHPGPLIVRDGRVIELDSGGPFMGMVPDVPFPERTATLQRGDAVFAFTDGGTEAWNAQGEAFGDERLHQALIEAATTQRPARDVVLEHLVAFAGPGPRLADDLTLVGVRWLPPTDDVAGET